MLGQTRLPFTILILLILTGLLILYAVWVSLSPIKPIEQRQRGAKIAGVILVLAILAVLIEIHAALLRLTFESQNLIKAPSVAVPGTEVFRVHVQQRQGVRAVYQPVRAAGSAVLQGSESKATTGESASWGDFARKVASRVVCCCRLHRPAIALACHDATGVWGTEIPNVPASAAAWTATGKISARRLAACARFPAEVFRENGLLARRISLVRDRCRRALPVLADPER